MTRFHILIGKHCVVFVLALLLAAPLNAQVTLRKALDFDGDGKADWSIFRPSTNTWWILGSGGSITGQEWGAASTDFLTPGDFDGDNRGDIAVWRETNGVWYVLRSSNSTITGFVWGAAGDEPVARDYDGDGKTDYAVARRTNGEMLWYIYRSSDNGAAVYLWGSATDFVAPGDFDGDGKFDIAVQRTGATADSPLAWYIFASKEGGKAFTYGISTDVFVPGDYDGDGRTDIAVVREGPTPDSPLAWYILRSSSTFFDIWAVGYGISGTDVVVQNDYDGDGRTDIAVWRTTTGAFYNLNSSNGVTKAVGWGNSTDEPIAGYDTH